MILNLSSDHDGLLRLPGPQECALPLPGFETGSEHPLLGRAERGCVSILRLEAAWAPDRRGEYRVTCFLKGCFDHWNRSVKESAARTDHEQDKAAREREGGELRTGRTMGIRFHSPRRRSAATVAPKVNFVLQQ